MPGTGVPGYYRNVPSGQRPSFKSGSKLPHSIALTASAPVQWDRDGLALLFGGKDAEGMRRNGHLEGGTAAAAKAAATTASTPAATASAAKAAATAA